uniref:Uncharacterized protein n=1 Tax=Scophthalmus maximus TaxID=52904 RepID=A0A8D2ZYX1_SCOMX
MDATQSPEYVSRHHVPLSTDTEMRDNYRRPKQNPELMSNHSHYCNNTRPNVARRGIVPTVVQRQVHTKQKGSDVTTYDRFYGKRATNITSTYFWIPHVAGFALSNAVLKSFLNEHYSCLC